MKHATSIMAVGFCVLVSAAAAAADLELQIDRIVQPLISEKKSVGIAVGTISGEGRQVFGYGRKSLKTDEQPGGDTLFEIGSITKVFTTLLLADMAEDGLVKLDDPVGLYLPDSVKVPTRGGKEITLLHLATHTSSLPRLPYNFLASQLRSWRNPYLHYTAELMYSFLSAHELRRDIGARYEYSNFAMGLLGHVLARCANMDYDKLLVRRICDPLEMNDTRAALSPEQRLRLAQGHTIWGKPGWNWDFDALAGAGALRSTVNDLLVFLSANLGLTKTDLLSAMQACHAPRHETDLEEIRIGLGWHILEPIGTDRQIVWHNGCTGGYHSYIGFIKETQTGVVVLSNSVNPIEAAAMEILKLLNPDWE